MTGDRAVLRPLRGRLNDGRVFSRRLAALEEAAPAVGYSGWAWLRRQDVRSKADISRRQLRFCRVSARALHRGQEAFRRSVSRPRLM